MLLTQQVIKLILNPQEPFTFEKPQDLTIIYPRRFGDHKRNQFFEVILQCQQKTSDFNENILFFYSFIFLVTFCEWDIFV